MDKKLKQRLNILFNPSSVAVIGASNNTGKLGYHVMKSLNLCGFRGEVIPVNPGSKEIMGISTAPDLESYKGKIDLAIVVVPSKRVPDVFLQCVKKEVQGIVLITAGFKEIEDPTGSKLHNQLYEIVNSAQIPVIGPNTFGMINYYKKLNASFTPEFSYLPEGHVALVSQSGGMSHLLAFMGMRAGTGFSKIVGLGNRLNIDFPQMIEFLMDDPDTRVIALYVEGIDTAGELINVSRQYKGRKPIIAYKTGSARVGNKASMSHTGSLAGNHRIYKSAFRQAGILHVEDSQQLLDTAKALATCPLMRGPGVAILTAQAGPGMAGADICENQGIRITPFTDKTQAIINRLLPPLALRTNPVDMGPAWYDSSALKGIVKSVMEDENVHGILLFMMFASANVDALKGLSDILMDWNQKKPLLSCIAAPPGIWDEQLDILEKSGAIVNYPTPERASLTMAMLWKYNLMINGR